MQLTSRREASGLAMRDERRLTPKTPFFYFCNNHTRILSDRLQVNCYSLQEKCFIHDVSIIANFRCRVVQFIDFIIMRMYMCIISYVRTVVRAQQLLTEDLLNTIHDVFLPSSSSKLCWYSKAIIQKAYQSRLSTTPSLVESLKR